MESGRYYSLEHKRLDIKVLELERLVRDEMEIFGNIASECPSYPELKSAEKDLSEYLDDYLDENSEPSSEFDMRKFFKKGEKIYGFCNGFFGRDDYDTKICVMVSQKYALFEYVDGDSKGYAVVLNDPERLDDETIESWKKEIYF